LNYACSTLAEGEWLNLDIKDSRIGMAASLIIQRKIWDHGALFIQCGAKTAGYLPGEGLNASPIVRVGITLW
jgi:hypothetical protein